MDRLKVIFWVENRLTKILPKMARAATSTELRLIFEYHLSETQGHANRLRQIFNLMKEEATTKKCETIDCLTEEGDEMVENLPKGSLTRDWGLLMIAQKVEHYEIATYETLANFAQFLGYNETTDLLESNLEEEYKANDKLTQLVKQAIN